MSRKIAMLLSVGFGLSSAFHSAHAAAEDTAGASRHGDVTAYDFEDDLVHGDLVRPDGEVLTVRRHGARDSLVRARLHYVPELLKSAEDL